MDKHVSSGLKTTFLAHFIIALAFGLIYLLIPELWGSWIGWPVTDPPIYRLLGAAVLAFGASSWLAYREPAWEKVKIVVQMELIWTILGALVILWGLVFAGLPAFGWLNAVILAGFAVAFGTFYSRG